MPDDGRVAEHVERLGGQRAQRRKRERDDLSRPRHSASALTGAASTPGSFADARRAGGASPRFGRADTLGAVEALNFYNPLVADQLRSRRKTVTIRLGDKSAKYRKGLCLKVLCGQRFGPRTHVFDAVVDKVEVKRLGDVSPRELQHDNPELRTLDEFVVFLGQLYNRDVSDEDTVTVIHFSEIRPSALVDRRLSRAWRRRPRPRPRTEAPRTAARGARACAGSAGRRTPPRAGPRRSPST